MAKVDYSEEELEYLVAIIDSEIHEGGVFPDEVLNNMLKKTESVRQEDTKG